MAEWASPEREGEVTAKDFETLDLPVTVLSRPESGMHYAMHVGLSVVGAAPSLKELYAQVQEFIATQKRTLITLGGHELAWRFVCGLYGFVAGVLTLLLVFHG
jgi:hypothetical protein